MLTAKAQYIAPRIYRPSNEKDTPNGFDKVLYIEKLV